ncbi:uncharacterized protein LOC114070320 isoform X2 [Empidonax traillii]|uniref:uncharacterized protein LOC114070320 isoform X2 n=1 Tax=Empidonax traillii TaxID=164674 RepID=UPI000FFD533A|nr:uncharacterized protein LOC114070320 isoform X2 [Empidonax traillii]
MLENGSLRNCCDPGGRSRLGLAEREAGAAGSPRPAWVVPVLSSVLIFTTVVDILGNLLVILSVFRNRKLRNSATPQALSEPFPAHRARAPLGLRSVLLGPGERNALNEALCALCGAPEEGESVRGNRCHPLKIPETKRVFKTVGGKMKFEFLKLAQKS